jgi:hypothetical protein
MQSRPGRMSCAATASRSCTTRAPSRGDRRWPGCDLTSLEERHKVFWVMKLGQTIGHEVMTPGELSAVLRDVYGFSVPRQRIEGMLRSEKQTVARRTRSKRRVYQLMNPGADELESARSVVMFIEPSTRYSKLRETHALLRVMTGDVRVCDPYADLKTLDLLAECEGATGIRLLTHNVKSKTGLKQAVKAFSTEHGIPLEVRIAPPKILHDRYAIHDDGMVMFGASLNSIGLKQSFVVALGQDIRATVLGAFEATWQNSTPL